MQTLADTLTPLTFSIEKDADAEKLSSILHALGYDAIRVDPRTHERVGLTLRQLVRRYDLGTLEREVVEALLDGARERDEIVESTGRSPRMVDYARQVLRGKLPIDEIDEIPALLQQLPEGYTIDRRPDDASGCTLRLWWDSGLVWNAPAELVEEGPDRDGLVSLARSRV